MNIETMQRFKRLGTLTIFAVYFVILVGGIVRASGSGMGCPDWPTCFGQLIPPTSEAELPENYHEIYAVGYANTDFNVIKTWTEYLNRLTGVTIGILIMMTLWSSRAYLKTDKAVFYLSLSVFLLVSFQGWLGAMVVKSHLQPFMITAHMLLALFIVALLIYAIARSQQFSLQNINTSQLPKHFKKILITAMGMTLLQIAMGTQVREAVDVIALQHDYLDREYWASSFPIIFYIHRSFSSLILFVNLWIVWKIHQSVDKSNLLFKLAYTLIALIITAILAGIVLDRLAIPPIVQPIHLLIATLIFGLQFFIYICLHYSSQTIKSNIND
jgi:cytochrome c oxidase assembly protein subunit 15